MQQHEAYSGTENLEIMREAENYNRYLLNTVLRYAKKTHRILDFGAGSGQFSLPLAALGFDVTAVELDDSLRGGLRDQGLKTAPSTQGLSGESFDYVYTLNVLEHIDDDVQTLRELHSRMVGQGRLLIYVPAFPILYTSMDANVGHVRRYTRSTLVTSVMSAGFCIDHVAYVDSIGFLATLLFKLAGNKDGNVSAMALKLYDRLVFPLSRTVDIVTRRWFGKNLLLLARKTTQ